MKKCHELAEVQSSSADGVFCLCGSGRGPGSPAVRRLPGTALGRSDSAQCSGKGNAPPFQNPTKATLALFHAVIAEEERSAARIEKKNKKKNRQGQGGGRKKKNTWKKKTLYSINALDSFFDLMLTLVLHNSGGENAAAHLPSPSRDLGRATDTRPAPGTALPPCF